MANWTRELRLALRTLTRTPGFTATTVGTLALAIGVTAGVFGVVNKVLLDPLPYASPGRLIQIVASAPGSDMPPQFGVAAEFFVQYREQSKLLEDISTYNSFTSTLRVGDRVERVRMSQPTTTLFSTLGVTPFIGRLPTPADEDRAVVISHDLWMSWFGGDEKVLNTTASISGSMRTIVGVMRPEFAFPVDGTVIWISSTIRPDGIVPGRFGSPLVARLKPGATIEAVTAELNTLASGLPARFGGSAAYARIIGQHRAVVQPLEDAVFGTVARPLWILFAAVCIVLLIACANVANLFMVRAEGRQRDLAVRRAIGAARGQLIRVQMAEAVVVAGLAGVLAVVFALVALPAFLRAAPPGVPRLALASIDATTIAFTFAVAALAALACGAVPALRASTPDFTRLRDSSRSSTGRRHWGRDALVVGQTALALVLLIGSGLLVRSFWALRGVDPGYDTRDVFTFQIAPEGPHLPDGPAFARFSLNFMERLRALPGVESVGLVENVPLNEGTAAVRFRTERHTGEADTGPLLRWTFSAGDYNKTMGIRVIEGRPFDTTDHLQGLPHAVISQSAAKVLWPGESAVGKRLQRQGMTAWYTVIGVVEDVMQDNFREPPNPLVYYPLAGPEPRSWVISSPAYVIKTARAEEIATDVRAIVRQVAPEAPMYRTFTMAGLARDSMVDVLFTMLTLGVASGLALVLGAVGLYGVLSYVVAARTREIGVRMALGARADQVRRMVVGQGIRVVLIGIALGIGAAVLATRALGTLLFGVTAVDTGTFVAMASSMIAVGLVASYLPARRASNVDPIIALRGE
ncbi:MAG TPA: ABC transporter permease [Vicinamibacterales bacterium]|nr:ABC transporter permease [Vicinamibacterales bacterium]